MSNNINKIYIIQNMLRLGKIIGKGSDGEVYEIENDKDKVVKYIQCSNYGIKNYLEFYIINNIKHENINTALDITISNNGLVKVLQNKAISDLNRKIPIKKFKKIFYQCVKGLKYLNDMGIIHGDVKPSNILLFENDVIKYTDFSLSRLYNSKTERQLCSHFYRPPELNNGIIEPSKIDVFSLGCSMYEIYFKEPYFDREHNIHFKKFLSKNKQHFLTLIYKMTDPDYKLRYNLDDVCKDKYFNNTSFDDYKYQIILDPYFDNNDIIVDKSDNKQKIVGKFLDIDKKLKKFNFNIFLKKNNI